MSDALGVPRDVQEVLNESQSKLLAQLKIAGVTNDQAAIRLGVSLYRIRKIEEQEEFKTDLKEIAEGMMHTAANAWKGAMGNLIPKALKVLEDQLNKGNLEAVKVVIKSIGVEQHEQTQSAGNLTVVLPDFKPKEKSIDVEVQD